MGDWGDDAILTPTPRPAPSRSWWATPEAQSDRETFSQWARAEQQRIVGNSRFGGTKKVIDSFTSGGKKQR